MKDIVEGIRLFNEADFFAAHDFFENLWVESENSEKLFFQGLVQISVGCYHLVCGNYKGALSQYLKGKTKLENYPPSYYNIDLLQFTKEIDLILSDVKLVLLNSDHIIEYYKLPSIKTVK